MCTTTSTPQFRYWFANGQQWGHELAGDTHIPTYWAFDENGDAVVGELQLPAREFEFRRRGNTYGASNVLVGFTKLILLVTRDESLEVGLEIRVRRRLHRSDGR